MEKVKEATTEVVDKLRPKKAPWVSLRETLCSTGFDDKRGWRRMAALLGPVNAPFCRYRGDRRLLVLVCVKCQRARERAGTTPLAQLSFPLCLFYRTLRPVWGRK